MTFKAARVILLVFYDILCLAVSKGQIKHDIFAFNRNKIYSIDEVFIYDIGARPTTTERSESARLLIRRLVKSARLLFQGRFVNFHGRPFNHSDRAFNFRSTKLSRRRPLRLERG